MSLQATNNPTQAVFERVIARAVASPALHHRRLVHVFWTASQQGERLVQAYVNGRLSAVTGSMQARELWLMIDGSAHQQIELIAVDPIDAALEHAALLAGVDPPTTPSVDLALLRDYSLPIDSEVSAGTEGASETDRVPLFTSGDARGGFGAVFGEGGFGYDASVGPGLGRGELGYGPLGIDGDALRWRNDTLAPGDHTINLMLDTPDGAWAAASNLEFNSARLPEPPTGLTLDASLLLTWT